MLPTFFGEPAVLLVEPRHCPLWRDVVFRGRLEPFLEDSQPELNARGAALTSTGRVTQRSTPRRPLPSNQPRWPPPLVVTRATQSFAPASSGSSRTMGSSPELIASKGTRTSWRSSWLDAAL
jgi:hypothetical protein